MNAQAAYFAALDNLGYWSQLAQDCRAGIMKFAGDQTPEGQHWAQQFIKEQERVHRELDKAQAQAHEMHQLFLASQAA